MTVEELQILVDASIEPAINEMKKLMPQIRKHVLGAVEATQNAMNNIDMKNINNKIQQGLQLVKRKIENFKKNNKNNEMAIKVNNAEASKQITQLEKQINSLQEKINARQIKLGIITPKLDAIANQPMNKVMPERLDDNKQYINLGDKETQLVEEIKFYNKQLSEAKDKMAQLRKETEQTATAQNKLSSFFSGFKGKLEQAKTSIGGMKGHFKQLPKITQNITNNIKSMTNKIKGGIGHILKYAGALIGLRSIYNVLRSSAQSWLSSQNAQAQQLSANIEYMKYAMGSVFAPIIEYVINLVYQLMKAIQSLVYAFSKVNIFAKATASSMKSASGSAKQASKSLSGVHSEINNLSENNNSGGGGGVSPDFDLSKLDNTPNSIIEAIKNGDWYKVGETIGEKINEAMNKIPWDKIQNTARAIGKNTAQLLNGVFNKTNWNQVGNTFAQGINTIIYTGYEFVTNFKWSKFGKSIGETVNGFFKNIDWSVAGQTLSTGIKGILTSVKDFLKEVDWKAIGQDIKTFLVNIDWEGIAEEVGAVIGEAMGALVEIVLGALGDFWSEQWEKNFQPKIEECGGDILAGLALGFFENMGTGYVWVWEHLVKPIIDSFCELLGIHSPSTVFEEYGRNIIQGLLNGIKQLVDKIVQKWEEIKTNAQKKFSEIKNTIVNKIIEVRDKVVNKVTEIRNNISTKFNEVKAKVSNTWNNIKTTTSSMWNSMWNTIKKVINSILGGIERFVNGTIRGINRLLSGISSVASAVGSLIGLNPINLQLSTISLPRLAKGNVAYDETVAIFGEYSGARNNPEITAPQNVLRETFEDVLSDHEWNNRSSDEGKVFNFYLGNKKIATIVLDELRDLKRQTGQDLEVLVGG